MMGYLFLSFILGAVFASVGLLMWGRKVREREKAKEPPKTNWQALTFQALDCLRIVADSDQGPLGVYAFKCATRIENKIDAEFKVTENSGEVK